MEYDSRAPFLAHNLKLLEDTEYLQQKGRRVDLLGDESQLYAFFDARVPEGISTGAAFERWRREAEAKNPKLLWLTEQDISPGEAELDAERFPDHLSAGPLVVQLRYRFEPGHEDDGVSALIPLHVLNQLPEEAVRVAGAGPARREDRGAGAFAAEEPARAFRAGAGCRRARVAAARARQSARCTRSSPTRCCAPAVCRCRAMRSARICCRRTCA